jgi:hypothetical protein
MRSMEIDRRTFLALAGAAAIATPGKATAGSPVFLAARMKGGGHEVAVIDEQGHELLVLPVETRGHSFAIDAPRRRAVAFDRSPGRHAVAFDIDGKGTPQPLVAARDRHFFGHGIFSSDGRLMLANENDYESGRGVTGIYDASDGFRRLGEFNSGGIGPHDIVMMADDRTACIANGGILTHPDYDRLKLNIDTMAPSLAYLDTATGEIVEQASLPPDLHRLSIRHLALDARGDVWFGCQYEGDALDRPPLVGRHRRGRQPELFAGPDRTLRQLDNYIGSVAVDLSGEIVATSSPRGGLVVLWDAATGSYLGEKPLADGCGVAPFGAGRILASSGRGRLSAMDAADEPRQLLGENPDRAWDNHLRRIG